MKKTIAIAVLLLLCSALSAWAEEFGTVPLKEGGVKVRGDDTELVLKYQAAPEALWDFYKEQFASMAEIKYTDRGSFYTIEDMGSRPWRRIAITKTEASQTTVTIDMLTWTWIVVMLILRFFGVFIVLLILFVALSVAANLIQRAVKEKPAEVS